MAVTEQQSGEQTSGGANVGRIEEIQGVVIEAVFPEQLPEIFSALTVQSTVSSSTRCQWGSSTTLGAQRSTAWPGERWKSAREPYQIRVSPAGPSSTA